MNGAMQISPTKASAREERTPSSSGPNKGMGVKQIEEHVSTLTKQNFNLKLELHHRRERQSALEERLEAAERQIEEQQELQEVNEQLLAELEKRDQAVEEAVGIIVTLEDRIEKLMQEREVVRNFDDRYGSGYFRKSHEEPSRSQSTFGEKRQSSQAIARMPSFLSEQSEGAEALRSLYLPGHSHKNSDATIQKLEEEAQGEMNSPRLSALSVSSFMSIYGNKKLSLDNNEENEEEPPQRRLRKSSSVEKWIDERPISTTPLATRNDIRKNQFLSINDVMESPLQRLEKLKLTLEKNNQSSVSTRIKSERSPSREPRKSRETLRRVLTDKTSFDHQQGLPPTPDTISTGTLRHFQANSNDTLAQDAHEKTFLSSNSTIPAQNISYQAHQSTISIRPHSAGETITSRREGHGWDTETQGDDFSSTASTFSGYNFAQPKRVLTPNLFTFGDFDGDNRDGDWGTNKIFNNHDHRSHTASRYAALRSNSLAEHSHSDDITPRAARYNDSIYATSPIDTSPRPNPPDRRSSLGVTTKLRKVRDTTSTSTQAMPSVNSASSPTPKPEPKKSRLTSRLFGRSETSPVLSTTTFSQSQPAPSSKTKSNPGKSVPQSGAVYEDDDVARATPPPIKRSRDGSTTVPRYRPSSAGNPTGGIAQGQGFAQGMNTLRRTSAFANDGANDEVIEQKRRESVGVAEAEEGGGQAKSGRIWGVFARTGSVRNKQ